MKVRLLVRLVPLLLLPGIIAPPPAAAEDRPLLILLTDASRPLEGVSADSFALALLLQFRPYNVDIQLSQWSAPPSTEDQEGLASHRCRKTGASAVVWYTPDKASPPNPTAPAETASEGPPIKPPQIRVHMVAPWNGGFRRLSLAMGRPQQGIERSMATAVRTLVSAQLSRLPSKIPAKPTPDPKPAPPPPVEPPPAPVEEPSDFSGRVSIGAVYDLEFFPLKGIELRHGPTVVLGLRLYRGIRIQLGAGYRATNDGRSEEYWWSRDFLCVDLGITNGWELGGNLLMEVGGQIRATAVFSGAGDTPGQLQDDATLGELALGAIGSARVQIWSSLAALVRVRVSWLPVGHQLTIGGDQLVEPGALEASISLGLIFGLL